MSNHARAEADIKDLSKRCIDLEKENAELKSLIKRYINHIGDCEGITFIDGLSEADQDALNKIDEEGNE